MPDEGTTNWGRYAYLLDGDPFTYFISVHNQNHMKPAEPHYIQVDLQSNPVAAFKLAYKNSTKWPTFAMKDVNVYASNDTTDANNWVLVQQIQGISEDNVPTIIMDQEYRYIRFSVISTANMLKVGNGYSFSIGEFQLYPAELNEGTSAYNYIEGMKSLADDMMKLAGDDKEVAEEHLTTQDAIDALQAAIDAVKNLYVTSAKGAAVQGNAVGGIYGIDGVMRGQKVKGFNIIGNKTYYFNR